MNCGYLKVHANRQDQIYEADLACVSLRANSKNMYDQSSGIMRGAYKTISSYRQILLKDISKLIRKERKIINYKILSTNESFDLSRQSGSAFQRKGIRKLYSCQKSAFVYANGQLLRMLQVDFQILFQNQPARSE